MRPNRSMKALNIASTSVAFEMSARKNAASRPLLRMRWGGALTASSITFAEFTLISLFLLHHHGFEGTLLSILIGLIMALINNLHYLWMMRSFSSALNEDLNSLEPSHHFAATDAEPNGDVKDGQRDATS